MPGIPEAGRVCEFGASWRCVATLGYRVRPYFKKDMNPRGIFLTCNNLRLKTGKALQTDKTIAQVPPRQERTKEIAQGAVLTAQGTYG